MSLCTTQPAPFFHTVLKVAEREDLPPDHRLSAHFSCTLLAAWESSLETKDLSQIFGTHRRYLSAEEKG